MHRSMPAVGWYVPCAQLLHCRSEAYLHSNVLEPRALCLSSTCAPSYLYLHSILYYSVRSLRLPIACTGGGYGARTRWRCRMCPLGSVGMLCGRPLAVYSAMVAGSDRRGTARSRLHCRSRACLMHTPCTASRWWRRMPCTDRLGTRCTASCGQTQFPVHSAQRCTRCTRSCLRTARTFRRGTRSIGRRRAAD